MNKPEWIVEGRVWRVGDNVNTESITSSHWLHAGIDLLMEHIGELLIPEFPKDAKPGDVWVGGTNLGCSSSRNAPLYLKKKGIGAVVCGSAARIFYRNALNSGLPIFEIGSQVEKIRMGDRLKVDVREAAIENLTTGEKFQAKPFPRFVMDLLEAGGINSYILQHKSEYALLK
ncbi:MAG: 3-isopropylmalate dehydratase small subunit [Deltaproteobacteria bacterium]|nr:3-isopropylmalate dehydratase small subunit [Deltaproteobacteria bacterium]